MGTTALPNSQTAAGGGCGDEASSRAGVFWVSLALSVPPELLRLFQDLLGSPWPQLTLRGFPWAFLAIFGPPRASLGFLLPLKLKPETALKASLKLIASAFFRFAEIPGCP